MSTDAGCIAYSLAIATLDNTHVDLTYEFYYTKS